MQKRKTRDQVPTKVCLCMCLTFWLRLVIVVWFSPLSPVRLHTSNISLSGPYVGFATVNFPPPTRTQATAAKSKHCTGGDFFVFFTYRATSADSCVWYPGYLSLTCTPMRRCKSGKVDDTVARFRDSFLGDLGFAGAIDSGVVSICSPDLLL